MPYAPSEQNEDIRHGYEIETIYLHMVSRYTGLSVPAVLQLDLIDYLILRRDAYIQSFSRTDKGTEYLNNAWSYEQTEPDRDTLRRDFGMTRLEAEHE